MIWLKRHRCIVIASVSVALLAAVAPAHALDNETSDEVGRWLGSSNEAVQRFGASGETLRDLTKGDFAGAGTGSVKRSLRNEWNAALQPWKDASQTVRNSLPYKVLPNVFTISDVATSVVAPAIEGDGRGAMSGVANIAAATGAAAAGASLFGAVGSTIGAYLPMISTASGAAMIGGAIGPIAGGLIVAYAYDKYGKDAVGSFVEGLIALGDVDPLTQAMRAREEYFARQAAPELAREWQRGLDVSRSMGQEEEQLPGKLSGWYQPKPFQPQTQQQQQQPQASPTAPQPVSLANAKKIEIISWVPPGETKIRVLCSVESSRVDCSGGVTQKGFRAETQQSGTFSGNVIEFKEHVRVAYDHPACGTVVYEMDNTSTHTLAANGTETFRSGGAPTRIIVDKCGAKTGQTPPSQGIGTWRVIE